MKPDLDPLDVAAIEKRHAEQLRYTRVLYGQTDGQDDPDDTDPAPGPLGALVIAVVLIAVAAVIVIVATRPGLLS